MIVIVRSYEELNAVFGRVVADEQLWNYHSNMDVQCVWTLAYPRANTHSDRCGWFSFNGAVSQLSRDEIVCYAEWKRRTL